MRSSAGDQAAFGTRMEPYRRGLHIHCYRMLGSVQDADDMVQETFLRAWRRRDAVEGLSSLRAWLYTIATNACLDVLRRRPRRLVPAVRGEASALAEPIPAAIEEPIWLAPYPDTLLLKADEQTLEEQVAAREHVAMAFMVALHRLPPRQRAVLLLRDVLDWPAIEVAALLDTTVPAVKAALHRARATLADRRAASDADHGALLRGTAHAQLAAYVRAWEAADIEALVRLLREDATYSMPPIPAWYRGRETIRALLSRTVFGGQAEGRWRLLPTCANGQAAFGLYREAEVPGLYRAYGIQLVTLRDGSIGDGTTLMDAALCARFALPAALSAVPA